MTCPGQLYRYEARCYQDRRGSIVAKFSWVPLVRRSCPGCPTCNGYGPRDEARDADAEAVDIRCENPVDGGIYRADWVKQPLRGPDWVDEGDGYWNMIEVTT